MLNCHDATRLMSQSQERALSLVEQMSLKLHKMMCSGCRHFDEQMGAIRMVTRAYVQGKNEQEKR